MKILYVVKCFAPAWGHGGIVRISYDLAAGMAKLGHEVTVYTTDSLDETRIIKTLSENLNGIQIHRFKNISNWSAWYLRLCIPPAYCGYFKRNVANFDIVHFFEFREYLTMVSCFLLKKLHVPYLVSFYGQLPIGNREPVRRPLKRLFDFICGKKILREADLAVAQTESEVQEYTKKSVPENRVRFLPIAVNTREIILPAKGTFRKRNKIPEKEIIIMFLGKIHKYKGVSLLMEAFAQLPDPGNLYKLVIVGRDEGYLKTAKELSKKLAIGRKVVFAGPLYEQERFSAYMDADLFVLPALYKEETSLACLEACACYTPVIVTHNNFVPWLEEYRAGYVVNCNAREISEKMHGILSNNNLRQEMSVNARKLVEDKFSMDDLITGMEKCYLEAVKAHEKR